MRLRHFMSGRICLEKSLVIMNVSNWRGQLPQAILSFLPFLLFFPKGFRHIGVLLFILALISSGNYRDKWESVRRSPIFWPSMAMLAVTCFAAVFLDRSAEKFWSSFGHYQIYLLLLLFISVGSGSWQHRARYVFIIGAVYGATLFYLAAFGLLPQVELFFNYQVYTSNRSILLGILLALAAGSLLLEVVDGHSNRARWVALATYLYLSGAVLFFARTRTGALLLVILSGLVLIRAATRSWRRGVVLGLALLLALFSAWEFSSALRERTMQTVADVRAYASDGDPSSQGIRFEMYDITARIAAEKPFVGHGLGQWLPLYRQRAQGLASAAMTTPHNEYLLHATELGLLGLTALLGIWFAQLLTAHRIGGRSGMHLAMLTWTLMVGGMFNAVLRDAVLGISFMILLAIPLAGIRSPVRAVQTDARTPHEKRAAT